MQAVTTDTKHEVQLTKRTNADLFNETKGAGTCPKCNGKGWIMKQVEHFGMLYDCTVPCECYIKAQNEQRMSNCGLSDIIAKCTFDTFNATEEWQKRLKAHAVEFVENPVGWFYVGGQSGCGKTHICTAIVKELMDKGLDVRYMVWASEVIRLKANKNDDEVYSRLISPYQTCKVLYIDDFFKMPKSSMQKPTQSDIMTAFEILNYRYNNKKLITIISTEQSIDNIIEFDEALGSRIYEMTKDNSAHNRNVLKIEDGRNYRLKK